MKTVLPPRRRGVTGAACAFLLLILSLLAAPSLPVHADDAGNRAAAYQERAEAEKDTRTRFRRLEVASLVFILLAGGAAIIWAVRRK
jgi:hypothetical protein